MSKNIGLVLVFAGLVLLAIWRALITVHLRGGINIFSFIGGVLLVGLGFGILKRHRRS